MYYEMCKSKDDTNIIAKIDITVGSLVWRFHNRNKILKSEKKKIEHHHLIWNF